MTTPGLSWPLPVQAARLWEALRRRRCDDAQARQTAYCVLSQLGAMSEYERVRQMAKRALIVVPDGPAPNNGGNAA